MVKISILDLLKCLLCSVDSGTLRFSVCFRVLRIKPEALCMVDHRQVVETHKWSAMSSIIR